MKKIILIYRQQLKQYEDLLDNQMEEEQKRAIQTIRRQREEEWAKKRKYAEMILQQIRKNEEQRLQEMETLRRVKYYS